jgi:RNA recognition motif-containing protein
MAAIAKARANKPARPASSSNVGSLVSKTASRNITSASDAPSPGKAPAPTAVRAMLANVAENATERDIRTVFKEFVLCGSEVQLKNGYCFVWVVSNAEAQRAVTSLNGRSIRGMSVKVNIPTS